MPFVNQVKTFLDRPGVRPILAPIVSQMARASRNGVAKISYDDGVWIHDTASGYFAYHQPYVRLDLPRLDAIARENFFWRYKPRAGDCIVDVGAGVGEETLTFSRAAGPMGKVICIEAHPRTYRCLQKLISYNRLNNVIALHIAATEPSCSMATIEDSAEYLGNRLHTARGLSVPATTLDAIHDQLRLGQIDFLKMNIEGAERFAIQGMAKTLRQTAVVCISCHDFLAETTHNEDLKTKATIRQFLERSGFDVTTRDAAGLPPYLRDQVWGHNQQIEHPSA